MLNDQHRTLSFEALNLEGCRGGLGEGGWGLGVFSRYTVTNGTFIGVFEFLSVTFAVTNRYKPLRIRNILWHF